MKSNITIGPGLVTKLLYTQGGHETIVKGINCLMTYCHGLAKAAGWWTNVQTGEPIEAKSVICEKLLLIHSEISEAAEGVRKNLMDDHLPHRTMLECELADGAIRLFDLAGALDIDLAEVIYEKLVYNSKREDHKIENRALDGGKKF